MTVTLQKPPRAKRDPSAIVPKLEAAVVSPGNQSVLQSRSLLRPPIRSRDGGDRRRHARSEDAAPRRAGPGRPERMDNGASSSSRVPPLRIPLLALQDGGGEGQEAGGEAGCEREVWVSVFRYLSRAELCVCMAVCKNWYKIGRASCRERVSSPV